MCSILWPKAIISRRWQGAWQIFILLIISANGGCEDEFLTDNLTRYPSNDHVNCLIWSWPELNRLHFPWFYHYNANVEEIPPNFSSMNFDVPSEEFSELSTRINEGWRKRFKLSWMSYAHSCHYTTIITTSVTTPQPSPHLLLLSYLVRL